MPEPTRLARQPAIKAAAMRIEATQQTTAAKVTGAIQQAAKATGTSFQYLLATAKVESNLNPNAEAKTSSAGGLFQFIEQTWLGTIKEAGTSFGYGRHANAITRTESGRYAVADPAMKAEILKLRQDPTANAVMAGVLTRSNAAILSQKLGRPPSDGELYIAHFLGANGAAKLIGQSEQLPATNAASVFPNAARANRSIFFNKDGRARNVAEVSNELSNRFQVAAARQSAPVALAQMAPAQAAPVAATRPMPPISGISPASAIRPVQDAQDFTPVTASANARVARAYEVLSPNMLRALASPMSTSSVPQAAVAPAMLPAAPRPQASIAGEQVYSNPYRVAERRQAVAPAVSDLWSQAAANVARARALSGTTASAEIRKPVQRMASAAPDLAPAQIAQPQQAAHARNTAAAPSSASAEPLGLFQDIKPNVRALFTGG